MKTHYRLRSFLIIASSSLLSISLTHAATGTWNVDANGLWSGTTNWSASTIADGAGFIANFTNNITADRTVSLDSDRTINRVNFSDSDTSSAGSWILDNNGTATNNLILSGTTGAASGTVPVIDVLAGKTATISAVIEGTYGLSKTSSGTLILTGNNTLSGSVSILNGGKLIAGHNNAFGTATVTINNTGSTLELADGITLNNAITIAAQGNAKGIRSGSAAITGNITLTEDVVGNAEIRVSAGGTLTLSGNISGNGFEKLDPGTIILTGTNTYAGGTLVNGGIVDFANKAAKPATGAVTANAFGSVGLGVKASDAAYYSATDVGNLFNGTLTGFSLNAASGVAIDTTNAGADFDQTVALTAGRALTKLGTGTLILSKTNTYTGATTVSAGKLAVNGSTSASSAVGVSSGGTLAGSGTVGGNATIASGGTLAPGNSPGVLNIAGTTTLNSGSMFEWEIDTAQSSPETNRGVAYDGINTTALAGAGAIFKIMLTGTQDFTDDFWNQTRTWTDIFKSADGSATLSDWASVFSGGFQYSYNGQNVVPSTQGSFTATGNSLTWSAVPEPSNAVLGLFAATALLRRRRNS